jgi:hypothetical protein
MLHPSLAFRLSSLTNAGLRYWPHRLEDKHLGLQIARHGLKLVNDPLIYGDYNLDPGSRSGMTAARTNLSLNLAYLWQVRRLDLAPAAVVLFVASALFPAQWLRRLRKVMRRGIKNGEAPELTPCSEYADENDGEKTARRPRGQARTGRHR